MFKYRTFLENFLDDKKFSPMYTVKLNTCLHRNSLEVHMASSIKMVLLAHKHAQDKGAGRLTEVNIMPGRVRVGLVIR